METSKDADPVESKRCKGVWFFDARWWFEDETNNFVGPYPNEEQAIQKFNEYQKELL